MSETACGRRARAGSAARARLLAAGAVLLLAIAAPVAQQGRPIPNAVSDPNASGSAVVVAPGPQAFVAPGPEPDLVILFTARVVGYVEPCG